MGLESITNKTGIRTGVTVTQRTNIAGVMSSVMEIKIHRDFKAIYKYGKVIIELRDTANALLPDDTELELRYSQRDAVMPVHLSDRLTDVYRLVSFHTRDQSKAENLLELEPIVEGEVEKEVNENEIVELFIRSPVIISHLNSRIELFNWDIRQVK